MHVNRVPIGGTIVKSIYNPGKFLNASLDKASVDNERQSLVVETSIPSSPSSKKSEKDTASAKSSKNHEAKSVKIGFTQIAGLIARRIRCDIREGDVVSTGHRFGLIRFGSRCDIYLPESATPKVIKGQKTIAGETIIADLTDTDTDHLTGKVI